MPTQKTPAEHSSALPQPIQLTPDQIKEVAGGSTVPAVAVTRKGIPAAS